MKPTELFHPLGGIERIERMMNLPSSAKSLLTFIFLVIVGSLVVFCSFCYLVTLGTPDWVDRRTQRKIVSERIQSEGGLVALQRDCDALMEHNQDHGFFWWHGESTNALPPALAILKPMEVRFNPPVFVRKFPGESEVPVVRIKIFGLHATGGHATPYFGFDVVSSTNKGYYRPAPSTAASGNCHDTYRKVTDKIYEVF